MSRRQKIGLIILLLVLPITCFSNAFPSDLTRGSMVCLGFWLMVTGLVLLFRQPVININE